MANATKRIPPHNIEAEQSVLGAMLIDKDAIINVAGTLLPEHFYDSRHQLIYEAIFNLFTSGRSVDLVTLADELKSNRNLRKAGGNTYLTDLASSVPTSAHAQEYAEIVKENAVRRGLISVGAKMTDFAFDETLPVVDIVDKSEQLLFNVAQKGVDGDFVHIKDLLRDAYERAAKTDQTDAMGISTGFKDLDQLLGGFQPSDLIIVAARPSVGKTSLALDMLRHAGMKEKKKVAFFSLEMGTEQIIDRLLGMESGISFWEIRTRNLSEDKLIKLTETMGEMADSNIFIHDKPGQTINEIRTRARRLALEQGVDIIFVDYLQLIHAPGNESRTVEVSMISQGLKNIARELKVPVVALSQLSRAIEQRGGQRRPQLSDLRDSGSIEQDADVVMFIDREEQYNPDTERKGIGDLYVAKHRNGPTGHIELAWIKELASFRNLLKK